jgi:catechol 2,3-dioxygenase-like lactoylglutathione lyase family enzyme
VGIYNTSEGERKALTSRLDYAVYYAKLGWPVFPVNSRGPKTPLIAGGHNAATTDLEQIITWWTRWPGARIGAPTGIGFVVLDVDVRDDRNGFATLAELFGTAELPQTRTTRTPSGGVHLYFEVPEPPIRNTTGASGHRGIGIGLDWRGVGGFVLLPAPGTGYEWLSEAEALAPVPPGLMPKPAPLRAVGVARPCMADALRQRGADVGIEQHPASAEWRARSHAASRVLASAPSPAPVMCRWIWRSRSYSSSRTS